VRAVRGALPPGVPVTVKHRAGWDEDHLDAPEFACALVEAGAAMITVHGAPAARASRGSARTPSSGACARRVPAAIPVVGNGDVRSADDYFRMRDETGCDAG